MSYKYINHKWETPINYSFSVYEGKRFLSHYFEHRLEAIEYLDGLKLFSSPTTKTSSDSSKKLKEIFNELVVNRRVPENLTFFSRKFEISKLLYENYNNDLKGEGNFNNLEIYVLLCNCLLEAYKLSKRLQDLNTSLKINDIIISRLDEVKTQTLNSNIKHNIVSETNFVRNLINDK